MKALLCIWTSHATCTWLSARNSCQLQWSWYNKRIHFIPKRMMLLNSLRPKQNGRHVADDIFKRIFLNENIIILSWISLKFVPKGPINNIPALVGIMAWRRPGDKPLSEPMMVRSPTHICVTRPQWVKTPCREWVILYDYIFRKILNVRL